MGSAPLRESVRASFRQGRFLRYPSQAKPVSISSEPLLTSFSPFLPADIENTLTSVQKVCRGISLCLVDI